MHTGKQTGGVWSALDKISQELGSDQSRLTFVADVRPVYSYLTDEGYLAVNPLDGVLDKAVRSFERVADIRPLLTDQRIDVMRTVMTDSPESIQALAGSLDQNYADVHGDVQVLAKHHIIYFDTDGRAKRPIISYDRVRVDIEVAGDPAGDRAPA